MIIHIKGVKKILLSLTLLVALVMPVALSTSPAAAANKPAQTVNISTALPFQNCASWKSSVVNSAKARGDKIVSAKCFWNVRKGYSGWRGEVSVKTYSWRLKSWQTLYYARDFSR